MTPYSNLRAMRALTKASLQSILRSPSAVFFGLGFPLIFILVFGSLGNGGGYSIHVADSKGSDTSNILYQSLKMVPVLKWNYYSTDSEANKAMSSGDLVAQLNIKAAPNAASKYAITINGASTEMQKVQQLRTIINEVVRTQNPEITKLTSEIATVAIQQAEIRAYKSIDFILPGQLGFSLLAGSVFGAAFVFFNLRQTLVLKRFFATPVRREIIILSEGLARMIFQMLTSVVIILIGHFAFGFTLIHGWLTFLEMMALSALAVMVFLGFGFIVSSVAKTDAVIPLFSNIITLPQFLLAGTFFSISVFPNWLQIITRALPLTYLNDALREVAFNGASFWQIRYDILALLIWGVIVYFIAGRVFKWE